MEVSNGQRPVQYTIILFYIIQSFFKLHFNWSSHYFKVTFELQSNLY